jgi:hypothetical protein
MIIRACPLGAGNARFMFFSSERSMVLSYRVLGLLGGFYLVLGCLGLYFARSC